MQKYLLFILTVLPTRNRDTFWEQTYRQAHTESHLFEHRQPQLNFRCTESLPHTLRTTQAQLQRRNIKNYFFLSWKQNKDSLQTKAKCVFLLVSAFLMFLMSRRKGGVSGKPFGISKYKKRGKMLLKLFRSAMNLCQEYPPIAMSYLNSVTSSVPGKAHL